MYVPDSCMMILLARSSNNDDIHGNNCMKQVRIIFISLFFFGCIVQGTSRLIAGESVDSSLWADEIKFILTQDARAYDFYGAYGHPGTTIVELGILFHKLFGISFNNSVALAISLLVAGAAAACSALCFLIDSRSLWWLATGLVLLLNRMYLNATPPTTVVMPFMALIILSAWWLWERQLEASDWRYVAWGVVIGLSAATRLEVTVLVAIPMVLTVSYHKGSITMLPTFAGALLGFIVADPFLWFMPIRHVTDLVRKFTIHYAHYSSSKIDPVDFINFMWLAALSFCWALFLFYKRRLADIMPLPIVVVFSLISVLSLIGMFSSTFQAVRYLFPLIVVWEVLLPLFALKTVAIYPSLAKSQNTPVMSLAIIILSIITQLFAYLTIFI
jgi:hypothetical protein